MANGILIVDDSAFQRELLKSILVAGGYSIAGEASDGHDAVAKYMALKPALVTMDVVMPVKNGIESAKEILSADAGARIVMCSAVAEEATMLEAIEAGAVDYVIKPVRPDDVLAVVARALR